MGKDQQSEKKEGKQEKQPEKKKIIRKFPFKKTKDSHKDDDELKNWKPTKIERKTQKNAQSTHVTNKNIASLFLGSLPQPVNKPALHEINKKSITFDEDDPIKIIKKPVKQKLTEQQIKWDIQDQSFIRKEFIPKQKIQEKFNQEEVDDEPQQIIILKGSKQQPTKVRHIDMNKIINDNWQENNEKLKRRNELWQSAEGLLEGRGQLSKLADDAIKRATEIDDSINTREMQKKRMRNRYGW